MSEWKFTGWHKGNVFTFNRPNGDYIAFVRKEEKEALEQQLKDCREWIEIELDELADDDQTIHLETGRELLKGGK